MKKAVGPPYSGKLNVRWDGKGLVNQPGGASEALQRGNPQPTDRPPLPLLSQSFTLDALFCFQYREDAERVLKVLHKRFGRFGLTLHPDKTRIIEFGRYAMEQAEQGGKKPDTFDFLGFTHICARSRRGRFTIHLRTMRKRYRRSVTAITQWCRKHRHDPVATQCAALNAKLRGHYLYYGRPTNYRRLWQFYRAVRCTWRKWLNRRTRGKTLTWEVYDRQLLRRHPLLRPRITHTWPSSGSHA